MLAFLICSVKVHIPIYFLSLYVKLWFWIVRFSLSLPNYQKIYCIIMHKLRTDASTIALFQYWYVWSKLRPMISFFSLGIAVAMISVIHDIEILADAVSMLLLYRWEYFVFGLLVLHAVCIQNARTFCRSFLCTICLNAIKWFVQQLGYGLNVFNLG